VHLQPTVSIVPRILVQSEETSERVIIAGLEIVVIDIDDFSMPVRSTSLLLQYHHFYLGSVYERFVCNAINTDCVERYAVINDIAFFLGRKEFGV